MASEALPNALNGQPFKRKVGLYFRGVSFPWGFISVGVHFRGGFISLGFFPI